MISGGGTEIYRDLLQRGRIGRNTKDAGRLVSFP
jgi:hypothetical protein